MPAKLLVEGHRIHNDPLFYVGIMLVLMAMQLLMLGLLAEMNMRIYFESQQKPPYVVAETRNIKAAVQ